MFGKRIAAITLMLPFLTVSGAALADHNYQHHPNQVGSYPSQEAFAMAKHRKIKASTRVRAPAADFRPSNATTSPGPTFSHRNGGF